MQMPSTIENIMFAPCGMDCMICYVHLKKKKPCGGCLGNDVDKPERCKSCEIKTCTKTKGLTYCFSCETFPCTRIKALEKSYLKRYQTSPIQNSKSVKEDGFEQFFGSERVKWTCLDCMGVVSVHDKVCSDCGKKSEPNINKNGI